MTIDALIARARAEFRDMPGLRLTFAQACRLWQFDEPTCRAVLDRLVTEGVLHKTEDGFYVAWPVFRRHESRASARFVA